MRLLTFLIQHGFVHFLNSSFSSYCWRESSGLARHRSDPPGHLFCLYSPLKSVVLEPSHSKIWPKPNEKKQQGVTYVWTLGCFDHLFHLSIFEDTVVWSANVSGNGISCWRSIEYRLILLIGLFLWRDVTELGSNLLFSSEQRYMALS